MVNKRFWLGMLVIVLAFGMTVIGCDNGSTGGGNTDPKALVIQSVPASILVNGQNSYSATSQLGVFSAGTTLQQALALTNIVAGAYLDNGDITVTGSGPYSLLIPLYKSDNSGRWTGSGTYDVYVVLTGGGGHYYKASSVNISSGTTTIPFSSVTEVFLP
jgi:hypothetical protein